MAENVCNDCGKAIDKGGSVAFTPPESGATEKHLCISCFEKMDDEKNG